MERGGKREKEKRDKKRKEERPYQPHCHSKEWKCKLEEMHLKLKKCKRDEMEQHEPGDAAGGQIISGLRVVASVYNACKDSFVAADEQCTVKSKCVLISPAVVGFCL